MQSSTLSANIIVYSGVSAHTLSERVVTHRKAAVLGSRYSSLLHWGFRLR